MKVILRRSLTGVAESSWNQWPNARGLGGRMTVEFAALVMLATLFLAKQKAAGRNRWPMLSFNDLVTAMAHLLPRRQLTAEELATIITKRHRLRQNAKDSHARRSMATLE